MLPKGVTLRGLEVFEALASSGSVAQAAHATGLSQPAVSQQVSNLEAALEVDLIDRRRRPMRLTAAGSTFLVRAQAALAQLRLAQSELTEMDLAHLSSLSIGIIDDFEYDVIPRLSTILAERLRNCRFKMVTSPSHEILELISDGRLHIAISASLGSVIEEAYEFPLARDPFILVVPRGLVEDGHDPRLHDLPLLRYEQEQLIGKQIEAHIARNESVPEAKFEMGSHLALMAMVAERIGWAITTPMGYMCARRFHDRVEALPVPFQPFHRTISLYASADWSMEVPLSVASTTRSLLQSYIIEPALEKLPWLSGDLKLLDA